MFCLKTVKYTRLKHKQADFAFGGEDGVRRGNHYQNSVILYNLISGSGSLQKLSGVTFNHWASEWETKPRTLLCLYQRYSLMLLQL